ncbi:MAG: hypothetical protein ACI4SR_09810 [Faecalibacillus sp.]
MIQGWKRTFLYNWYYISVFIAGFLSLILIVGQWDIREKMLIGSAIMIFFHFFEEFGFPGGFAPIGMKVELKITDRNAHHWPLN